MSAVPKATRLEKVGLAASVAAFGCAGASELGHQLWHWDWMCALRSRLPLAGLFFVGVGTLVLATGFGLAIVGHMRKTSSRSKVGVVAVAGPVLVVLLLLFVDGFGFPGVRVLPIFPMRNEDCGGDPMGSPEVEGRAPLTRETLKDFGHDNTDSQEQLRPE